ncbi:MAG: zf-HC2 domain-containing protein, partial [Anaerolineae bacterium]
MKQQHVHRQIPDYVLGLLPQKEQQQVDQHTLVCADCRLALRREQELGQLVHNTLAAATQPPVNLRQFMPAIPRKPRQFWAFSLGWKRHSSHRARRLVLRPQRKYQDQAALQERVLLCGMYDARWP